MNKIVRKTIIILLVLASVSFCIFAAEKQVSFNDSTTKVAVEATAIEFMQKYTDNIYLYKTNNLHSYTAYAMTAKDRSAILCSYPSEKSYTRTRKYLQETEIRDNSEYIIEKAEYQKQLRILHGVTHEQFNADYEVHEININGAYAQVFLTEHKTFYYSGETIQSSLSDDYEMFLIREGEKWFVFDIICDDGFDSMYRKDDFKAEDAIAEFSRIYKGRNTDDDITLLSLDEPYSNVVTPRAYYYTQSRTYNRDNAVNYAYTYSKSNTDSFYDYYNSNFWKIRKEDGWDYNADCMNFVSQCFYAGFYGSNDSTSINGGCFPQDTIGNSSSSRWYAKPASTYWAWTGISNFNDYLSTCSSNTLETRMNVLQYSFPEVTDNDSSGYTLSTPYSLKGALAEVTGTGGLYGHAVIITTEKGKNRDQLYYTGHTRDAKHIIFSISYPTCPVKIVIPVSMNETTQCTNGGAHTYTTYASSYGQDSTCNTCGYCKLYVKNTLQNCVSQGSSITLSGGTNQQVYRMAMKVVAPNGDVSWLGEETCTNSYNRTFQFNQKGLYTITLYARDINPDAYPNDSTSVCGTYTIRCY